MASSALSRLVAGAADVIPKDGLQEKLALDRPLRVKLGIDPSRPDLHLGHAVVLRKLRHFQDAGHVAVLIVGDFTGRVGDPSGQSETRPFLTEEEIEENAATYLEQAGKVLDMSSAEVRRNSEWLAGMGMADVLRLTSAYTVARMLERDDFRKRYEEGKPISVVEFLYPLMQAMDSVAVRADVELGGTDQTFNLLVGRDIQRAYGEEPQVVLTMPLLEGIDGQRKMSKSFDNWVALTDPPDEMFGKLMSISDTLMWRYYELLTTEDVNAIKATHPMEAKLNLAYTIVARYHGQSAATDARTEFQQKFSNREFPTESAKRKVLPAGPTPLVAVITKAGLAPSKTEARRLIAQGGVELDGEKVTDSDRILPGEPGRDYRLKVGKKRFAVIRFEAKS